MKQLTKFALTAFFAGTLAVTTASAAEYSPSGSDALTAALVAQHYTGGGAVTVGPADGLQGTFVLQDPSMPPSGDVYSLNGLSLEGTAPMGKFFSSITAEGTAGAEFEVYLSETRYTDGNYEELGSLGTLTVGTPFVIDADKAYGYVALVGQDDVSCITFSYKQEGEAGPQGGVDHINNAAFKAQNPEGSFDSPWYSGDGVVVNPSASLAFDSGSKYESKGVISGYNDYYASGFWALEWDSSNYLYNTAPGGYITKVSADFAAWPESIQIIVSNEPLTSDNYYDGQYKTLSPSADDANHYEWVADGFYQYIYFRDYQKPLNNMTIEWSKEKPVLKAPAPSINSWEEPFANGSRINVQAKDGMCLDIKVYVDDVLDADLSKKYEESYVEIKAPGNTGQTLKVEAFAYAEGYEDSDVTTFERVLEMPQVAPVRMEGNIWQVCPGMKLVYATETEGALITYNLEILDYDNEANNKKFDEVTVPSPATITVPEEALVGQSIHLILKASAEGYQDSREEEGYFSVIDKKLPAPIFQIEDGTEVEQGTDLTIELPYVAKTLHYTINDGEEQTTEESYLHITLNEDATVTAWCSNVEPFEDSDKVTASYKVLIFGEQHYVMVPETFAKTDEDLRNDKKTRYEADVNGTKFVYDGGLWFESVLDHTTWNNVEVNHFWFATPESILYNDQEIENGISRVMLTSDNSWAESLVVISENKIDAVTDALKDETEPEGDKMVRVRVTSDMLGKWINVEDYVTAPSETPQPSEATDKKTFKPNYVAIFEPSNTWNSSIKRVVVEKNSTPTGVDAIEAEWDGTEVIYDLNGVRVSGENLNPGIYIRKAGNKTSKFVVK